MRIVLLLGLLVFFSSCKKVSIDDTDPEIEVFLFNGTDSPEEISVDSELKIELFITDNEELQEVLIKIENVSNGSLSDADKLLDLIVFSDIGSKQFGETIAVELSDQDKAGRYEVLLQVVDANGNVDSRVLEFVLLNPDVQPYLDINSYDPPIVDGIITISPGDSLVIDGWIVDDVGLQFLKVELDGAQWIYYEDVYIDQPGFTGYAFAWLQTPKIPPNAVVGDYNFSIEASSSDGHMSFFSQPVRVE